MHHCYIPTGSVDIPQLTVAVIDSSGVYVYSLPCSEAEAVWPGMTCSSVQDVLQPAPSTAPAASPCRNATEFCAVFTPWSQVGSHAAPYHE